MSSGFELSLSQITTDSLPQRSTIKGNPCPTLGDLQTETQLGGEITLDFQNELYTIICLQLQFPQAVTLFPTFYFHL